MRGVSKQALAIKHTQVPEGTLEPPRVMPFSTALTLSDSSIPVPSSTVIDTLGNHVKGRGKKWLQIIG